MVKECWTCNGIEYTREEGSTAFESNEPTVDLNSLRLINNVLYQIWSYVPFKKKWYSPVSYNLYWLPVPLKVCEYDESYRIFKNQTNMLLQSVATDTAINNKILSNATNIPEIMALVDRIVELEHQVKYLMNREN